MRARLLKPGFFTNEELAELPPMARLLFAGLWCLADREGRLEDRPKRIEAELFPYEAVDLDALLDQLASRQFVIRYELEGKRYLWLPTFSQHQKPHQHEAASQLPPCPEAMVTQCPDMDGQCSAVSKTVYKTVTDPKTVIKTVDGSRCQDNDETFIAFAKLYENEIGPLTGVIGQSLQELVDDGVPLRWFEEAVKIAAQNGKRKLSYLQGIIRNYWTDGFKEEERAGIDPVEAFRQKHLQPNGRRGGRDSAPLSSVMEQSTD